ncbi:SAM-dependent methyltransferase [Actinoplanes rectilineatus]|uniref:SAM-dependent methyltransferase n=1 Tax=Actinoplanes rectilineatus TaxID=113571 RepID=UPI0005F2BDE5|nr:SAM-dependent methyltransferase [Actinoplanes rectilineatus]
MDTSTFDRAVDARVHNYLAGERDNFAVDRAAVDEMITVVPQLRVMAVANREFIHRATRVLVERGITQFLDIGAGIPAHRNLHDTVQGAVPHARVIYVDYDPIVAVHARALLRSTAAGRVEYLDADLRYPATILTSSVLHDTFDLSRPVGLILSAVLPSLAAEDYPWSAVEAIRDTLPAGSCMVVTHLASDIPSGSGAAAAKLTAIAASHGLTLFPRGKAKVIRFFGDWELLDPGLVPVSAWRPNEPGYDYDLSGAWAGVACKR